MIFKGEGLFAEPGGLAILDGVNPGGGGPVKLEGRPPIPEGGPLITGGGESLLISGGILLG